MSNLYTTILHEVRIRSGLTLTEYVVCDTIDKLSNKNGHKWCEMTIEKMSTATGIPERTFTQACSRLRDMGYVEFAGARKRRTTDKWAKKLNMKHAEMADSEYESKQNLLVEHAESAEKHAEMADKPAESAAYYIYNINNKDNIYTLPQEFGSSPTQRLVSFYQRILKNKIGTAPTINYPLAGKVMSSLLKHTPEIQLAVLVMAHCNYKPTVYPMNKWLENILEQNSYPIEMFAKNINTYKSYLIYDKKVEYDDVETVREVVYKYLDKI